MEKGGGCEQVLQWHQRYGLGHGRSGKKMSIPRNPSFTPSPKLRDYLNQSQVGPTETLNALFDRYRTLVELDAIRLTKGERQALAAMLQGTVIDVVAIQAIAQDVVDETDCATLREKLQGATYGQCLATLERYQLL